VVHTIYEKERQKTHEVKNIYNIKKKAGLQFSFLEYIGYKTYTQRFPRGLQWWQAIP
jgi:hypothetical protein